MPGREGFHTLINGDLFSSLTNVRHLNAQRRQQYIANNGSGSLQMVSEPDTGRCASLLAVPRREVDTRRCANKDAGPQMGGFEGDPTSIGGRKECQRERWAPKGGGL